MERAVFTTMKDERVAAIVVRLGHASDDNRMIACVMSGLKIALKSRERPFDDWHPAMGLMCWHLGNRGLGVEDHVADIALIGGQNVNRKTT